MKRRVGLVGVVAPLCFAAVGCSAVGGEDAQPAAVKSAAASASAAASEKAPVSPETPGDFLDLAEKAMAAQHGWTFAVRGKEGLTLQGQQPSNASYTATVRRTSDPEALQSHGVIISSKGQRKPEEVFVVGGKGYVKEGDAGTWKHGALSDPVIANKVEDPVAAVQTFRTYLKQGGVTLTKADSHGKVRLQVRVASPRKVPEVQDRAYVKSAVREAEPVLDQLRGAGVAVDKSQVTLSRLTETLTLDARTGKVAAHAFRFAFLIPNGGQNITYTQDVSEENRGVFGGSIALPPGVS